MRYIDYIDLSFNENFTKRYKYTDDLVRLVIDSFYCGKTKITAQDCLDNNIYDIYFTKLSLDLSNDSTETSLYYHVDGKEIYFEILLEKSFTFSDLKKAISFLVNMSYDESCHSKVDLHYDVLNKEDFMTLIGHSSYKKKLEDHLFIAENSYKNMYEYVGIFYKIIRAGKHVIKSKLWTEMKNMASSMKSIEFSITNKLKNNYKEALDALNAQNAKYWETFLKTFYTSLFMCIIIEEEHMHEIKNKYIVIH